MPAAAWPEAQQGLQPLFPLSLLAEAGTSVGMKTARSSQCAHRTLGLLGSGNAVLRRSLEQLGSAAMPWVDLRCMRAQ